MTNLEKKITELIYEKYSCRCCEYYPERDKYCMLDCYCYNKFKLPDDFLRELCTYIKNEKKVSKTKEKR